MKNCRGEDIVIEPSKIKEEFEKVEKDYSVYLAELILQVCVL